MVTSGPRGSQLLLSDVGTAGSLPHFAVPWGREWMRGQRGDKWGALGLGGCGVCAFFGGKAAHPPIYSSLSLSFPSTLVNCHWKPLGISLPPTVCGELAERQDICTLTLPRGVCPTVRTPGCWQTRSLPPPTAPHLRSHASVGGQGLEVLRAGGQPAGTAEERLLLPPIPSGLAHRAQGE